MSNAGSLCAQMAAALVSGKLKCVDLTNTLSPDFPVIVLPAEFGQCAPFRIEMLSRYDENGPAWYWNNITMNEHTGTHFDAPAHWVTGKDLPDNTVDAVPVSDFVAPAVVVDISAEAATDADFVLTRAFLEDWEAKNGKIPPRHWVALRTDWYKRVGTPDYLNFKKDGAHSPGPDAGAMEFLVHERDCVGLAVETVGTDAGQASHFNPPLPAHSILHGNGRYGLQCLTNLDKLPTFGAMIVAAPLKIEGGSGSPLRVFALFDAE
jgi:kynurenine formamidase